MSGEQTALVRVQKNELVVAEWKIDEQIADAEKGRYTGRMIAAGSLGLLLASLVGIMLVPHVGIPLAVVGMISGAGGVAKAEINLSRIHKWGCRRREIVSQRQTIELTRLQRLDAAAAAALETERCAGTLAMGREVRVDFEDEAPKILRIVEIGSVFGDGGQLRLRVGASLYDGAFIGSKVVRDFEQMSQTTPPPGLGVQAPDPTPSPTSQSGTAKKLPPCTPV
jgi:hypothetical protein